MKLENAEHLTRYTIFHKGDKYIRIVEKPIEGETIINWMLISEETIFALGDEESEKLEKEFLKIIE